MSLDQHDARVQEILARGVYKQCPECQAGVPFGGWPDGWTLTMTHGRMNPDGPMQPMTFTPHSFEHPGIGAVPEENCV